MPDVPTLADPPIHCWFGLSYASYLVVPRLVLQSMPAEWQERFVKMLDEVEERYGEQYGSNEYRVNLVKDGKFCHDPLADYRHGKLDTDPRLE